MKLSAGLFWDLVSFFLISVSLKCYFWVFYLYKVLSHKFDFISLPKAGYLTVFKFTENTVTLATPNMFCKTSTFDTSALFWFPLAYGKHMSSNGDQELHAWTLGRFFPIVYSSKFSLQSYHALIPLLSTSFLYSMMAHQKIVSWNLYS